MRASMNLGRLNDAAQYRLERLHRLHRNLAVLDPSQQSQQLAYITIELDNLNICALREFTISTVRGAKTTKGHKVSVSNLLGPEEEIGAYILSILNSVKFHKMKNPVRIKRTDEPTIRDPKETEKILMAAGASNLNSLQNALALNTNLFRDLKYVRHFYAHRCKDTYIKACSGCASIGPPKPKHPDDILRHVVTGRAQPVLEQWIMEAKFFYHLLTE